MIKLVPITEIKLISVYCDKCDKKMNRVDVSLDENHKISYKYECPECHSTCFSKISPEATQYRFDESRAVVVSEEDLVGI